jgi:ParB/RepB/Spo0J family partition protein
MAKSQNDERQIVLVKVADLKLHRLQKRTFRDTTGIAFEQLKQAVKSGEIDPIEITTDNGIIDGHQRVRAANAAGVQEILAWVRDDLTDQQAIDERFVMVNLNRRQMSKLDQARAYQQLKRIQGKSGSGKGDTRDFLAQQFGVSGRTLDRYLRVLETPKVVHEAVDEGKLSMQDGADVSFLEPDIQDKIAGLIRKGEDPKSVVDRFAKQSRKKRRKPVRNPHRKRCRAFLEATGDVLARIGKHRTDAYKALYTDDEVLLKGLRTFCCKGLEYLEQNPRKRVTLDEAVAGIAAKVGHQEQLTSEVSSGSAGQL